MDIKDRKIILDNIDLLIDIINYKELLDYCFRKRVLSECMKGQIEGINDDRQKHRELLEKITKRGPTAFPIFSEFCKRHYPDAYAILDSKNEVSLKEIRSKNSNNNYLSRQESQHQLQNGASTSNEVKLEEYMEDVSNIGLIVKRSKQFNRYHDDKMDCYPMKSKNRGVFFLVNNNYRNKWNERNGSTVDRDKLVTVFQQFGFRVFCYEDLSAPRFRELLSQLIASMHLRLTDCFVFCILTHGTGGEGKYCVDFDDGTVMNVDEILNMFSNKRCEHLINKPKIFFFPFCRGLVSDRGVITKHQIEIETDSSDLDPIQNSNIKHYPTYSHMKICYAAVEGFKTHRDPNTGSWYIEALCHIFAEHAHNTDLDNMLKMVQTWIASRRSAAGLQQTTSNVDRGFDKILFFNPGYFEDNSK